MNEAWGRQHRINPDLVATTPELTPAETQVAVWLAEGNSVGDMADATGHTNGISSYGLKGWPMRCHCSSNASTAYCLSCSQYARFPPRLRTAKARTSWGSKMYARG